VELVFFCFGLRCDVIRKEAKINQIAAFLTEMSFDGRSVRSPHESSHILYIVRN